MWQSFCSFHCIWQVSVNEAISVYCQFWMGASLWLLPGMTKTEPRFGETFGFALFHQGSVLFASFFCPVSHVFCPIFPGFCLKMPVLARFRTVCSVSSKFARICSNLFVPCLPGFGHPWLLPTQHKLLCIVSETLLETLLKFGSQCHTTAENWDHGLLIVCVIWLGWLLLLLFSKKKKFY